MRWTKFLYEVCSLSLSLSLLFSTIFTTIVVMSRVRARDGGGEEKSLQLELPHHGNEKLLDLLDGASELQGGTVLGVLHGEQHVQLVRQVFPIRLAPILLLLVNQHTAAIIIRAFLPRHSRIPSAHSRGENKELRARHTTRNAKIAGLM